MIFRSVLRLLPVLAVAALFSSCASKPSVGFTKVKIYRLDPAKRVVAVDPSIPFEQLHRLYGAVTTSEREARRGNYYTFFWKAQDTKNPVQLRFDYLQSATGFQKKVKTLDVKDVHRSNVTEIGVIGNEFIQGGKVLAWQATLSQNGQIIGQRKSSLWE